MRSRAPQLRGIDEPLHGMFDAGESDHGRPRLPEAAPASPSLKLDVSPGGPNLPFANSAIAAKPGPSGSDSEFGGDIQAKLPDPRLTVLLGNMP